MTAKKLYLRSFGCQMNDYDSGRIADLLEERMGLEKTESLDEADVVILNTCSIREKAQEKVFSDLGRIREAKKCRPGMMIAVGGCVASQEGKKILDRLFCTVVLWYDGSRNFAPQRRCAPCCPKPKPFISM
mgnify:CR=1 FL=1